MVSADVKNPTHFRTWLLRSLPRVQSGSVSSCPFFYACPADHMVDRNSYHELDRLLVSVYDPDLRQLRGMAGNGDAAAYDEDIWHSRAWTSTRSWRLRA